MRIVMIGGAGFIGSNLAIKLSKLGFEVIVYDRDGTDIQKIGPYFGITYYTGDFINSIGMEEIINEGDCVIHLVSTSTPTSSNKDIYLDAQNNILPTIKLLQICVDKKVKKVIYASSGGTVYGIPKYLPIDEKHNNHPTSAYGIHKLTCEKYLELMNELHGIEVEIMRIANPYGPAQQPFKGQGVISTFLASIYLGKTIEIWGDGNSVRDYIYIDDLVDAFIKVIEYKGKIEIFNIGSGIGVSVNQILEAIETNTGIIAKVNYINNNIIDVRANILDIEHARKELNWSQTITLENGLRKMIECWNPYEEKFVIPY